MLMKYIPHSEDPFTARVWEKGDLARAFSEQHNFHAVLLRRDDPSNLEHMARLKEFEDLFLNKDDRLDEFLSILDCSKNKGPLRIKFNNDAEHGFYFKGAAKKNCSKYIWKVLNQFPFLKDDIIASIARHRAINATTAMFHIFKSLDDPKKALYPHLIRHHVHDGITSYHQIGGIGLLGLNQQISNNHHNGYFVDMNSIPTSANNSEWSLKAGDILDFNGTDSGIPFAHRRPDCVPLHRLAFSIYRPGTPIPNPEN